MTKSTIVKFRLDADLEAKLDRIVEAQGDRSKAIRYAIDIAEREVRREAALARLIAHAEEDQRRLKGKKPPRAGPWRMTRG